MNRKQSLTMSGKYKSIVLMHRYKTRKAEAQLELNIKLGNDKKKLRISTGALIAKWNSEHIRPMMERKASLMTDSKNMKPSPRSPRVVEDLGRIRTLSSYLSMGMDGTDISVTKEMVNAIVKLLSPIQNSTAIRRYSQWLEKKVKVVPVFQID